MKLRHYYLCATVLLIVVVVIIKFGETPYKVKEEFVKLSFHNEDFQSKPVSGETRQPLQEELVSSSTASVSSTTKSLSPTTNSSPTTKSLSPTTNSSPKTTVAVLPSIPMEINLVIYMHSVTVAEDFHQRNVTRFFEREKEILLVLQRNLQHPLIKRIHLLSENSTLAKNYFKGKNLSNFEKLVIYHNNRSASYRDVIQYISNNLLNQTVVFTNEDIYLGDGFDKVNVANMRNQKILYTLTRYNAPEGKCNDSYVCGKRYIGSHDTFLMHLSKKVPEAALKELEYQMGNWGSENRLMWAFQKYMNFCLLNPCTILKTYHMHCSGLRYKGRTRVNGGMSAVTGFTTRLTCTSVSSKPHQISPKMSSN